MAITVSSAQNIRSIEGNGLAVYLDNQGNLQLKDVNGKTSPLADYITIPPAVSTVFEEGAEDGSIQTVEGSNESNRPFASVLGGRFNTINYYGFFGGATDAVIVGGSYNSVCAYGGNGQFIGSGEQNYICSNADNAVIIGGSCNGIKNTNTGSKQFIGNGAFNRLDSGAQGYNAIVNGAYNEICSGKSFVGTGCRNTLSGGNYSFVGASKYGTLTGSYGFIGSGYYSTVLSGCSAIITGISNVINSGGHSFIGSGANNSTFDTGEEGGGYNSIVGGKQNQSRGCYSFVGNGCSNYASGFMGAVIVNGKDNTARGSYAFIGTGYRNTACNTAVVVGGQNNVASGQNSVIVGGINNDAISTTTFIGGGSNNNACQSLAVVTGGQCNTVLAGCGFIGGGYRNQISATAYQSVVVGGCDNLITSPFGTILGGSQNTVCGSTSANKFNSIIGGLCNKINNGLSNNYHYYNVILNGQCNTIDGGGCNVILNGCNNCTQTYNVVIANGRGNALTYGSDRTFIGGGDNNTFNSSSENFIGVGDVNTFCGGQANAIITGGSNQFLNDTRRGLINGNQNRIENSCFSSVIGLRSVVCGVDHAFAFGYEVVNLCANSFLTEQLRATNLCGGAINVCVNASGTLVRDLSDKRYKKSVKSVTRGLEKANALNPVTFEWNKKGEAIFGKKKQIGFIAQEVYQVIPEAVVISPDGQYGLSKDQLTAVSISAIKELTDHVCDLKNHICGICKNLNKK